ncbi:hypothetical protein IWW48_001475 [Coemansia sp. RSA 1200]|nr:hypothetical protein IWW48_001475 [Coemansia sp. RSA 1200]
MKLARCAVIVGRLLIGMGRTSALPEVETPLAEKMDMSERGATIQLAEPMPGTTSIQSEAQSPDVHQSACFECMVQQLLPISVLNIDHDEKELLASQLAEEYARLVDEAAESLQQSRNAVAEDVVSNIRARRGGLRLGSRLRPYEFLNSLYNKEGKRFFERMVDLLKKFVSTYAKIAASDDDTVSPSVSSKDGSKSTIAQPGSSTEEAHKSVEQGSSTPSPTSSAHVQSTTSSHKKIKSSTKASESDDEDDDEDDGDDDDDDAAGKGRDEDDRNDENYKRSNMKSTNHRKGTN